MALIRPSPALVVNSDTSIVESVRKMRENKVGSVLVLRASFPHDLVGIFTERDLLNRVEEIQQGDHWQKSIATVMQKAVYTVSVYDLDSAPEVMLKYKIRHLPVVYVDADTGQQLAGMISMRDLFQQLIRDESKKSLLDQASKNLEIGLVCHDERAKTILVSVLEQGGKAVLRNFSMTSPLTPVDVLVVDIDFYSARQWSSYLRKLNADPQCPPLIILFSPGLHAPKNVKLIHQLYDSPVGSAEIGRSRKTAVFAKPINILRFLQQLRAGF